MSLLLLFSGAAGDSTYTAPISIPPWGIDIRVGSDPLGAPGQPRPFGLNPVRNQYVRAIEGFDISYSLGNRGILHCTTVDAADDPTNAYRPVENDRITIATLTGKVVFFGKVAATRESSLESGSGFGTRVDIDAINDWEAFERTMLDRVFGSDRQDLLWVSSATGTLFRTVETHPFKTGDTVTVEGVVNTDAGVNGTHVVRRVDDFHFAVDTLNGTSTLGSSGSVRGRFYLSQALNYIIGEVASFGIVGDPTMPQGPLLEKVVLESSAADGLKALREQSGWIERLLPTNVLEMFAPGTRVAPFTLSGTNIIGTPEITRSREGYGNVVEVLYGASQTGAKTDRFVGNGVARYFPLTYRPASGFTTTSPGKALLYGESPLEGPIKEVEIRRGYPGQVFPTDHWWWYVAEEGEHGSIYYSFPAGPIVPGYAFGISYDVAFPQKVEVSAAPEVITEDGGRLVRRFDAPDIFDRTPALEFGWQMLDQVSSRPRQLNISTRAGLALPGSTITVTLPSRFLSGSTWLITAVTVHEDGDGAFRYVYTLLEDNKRQPGWIEYLKGLRDGSPSRSSSSSRPSPGSSGGGGGLNGGGTFNKIAKWISGTTLGDSIIEDTGTAVNVGAAVTVTGNVRAHAFRGNLFGGSGLTLQESGGTEVMATTPGTASVFFRGPMTIQNFLGSAANITLQPVGDLILNPGSKFVVPLTNYGVSLGSLPKKLLTIWAGELQVETLVAQDTIATIGGSILVAPTTKLKADVLSTDTVILVDLNNLFMNDALILKSQGKLEVMRVTGGPTGNATVGWTYSVLRNLDGSGVNAWFAGDAVANTGVPAEGPSPGFPVGRAASGFMDIFSVRGIKGAEWGPTIVGNVRFGYGAFDYGPRWALGNLRGLYSYNNGTDIYGVGLGNPNAAHITIDDRFFIMRSGPTPVGGGADSTNYRIYIDGLTGACYIRGIITVEGGNAAINDLSNVTVIDGGKITTRSIDASKINVGLLSAISANLGTVYAGVIVGVDINGSNIYGGVITGGSITGGSITGTTISGGTLYAGSGNEVTLNASGITLAAGTGAVNSVKWSNGALVRSFSSGTLLLQAYDSVWSELANGCLMVHDWDAFGPANGNSSSNVHLGRSGGPWRDIYMNGDMYLQGSSTRVFWDNPPSTTYQDEPLVWSVGNNQIFRRNDTFTGTVPALADIEVRGGLIVGWS